MFQSNTNNNTTNTKVNLKQRRGVLKKSSSRHHRRHQQTTFLLLVVSFVILLGIIGLLLFLITYSSSNSSSNGNNYQVATAGISTTTTTTTTTNDDDPRIFPYFGSSTLNTETFIPKGKLRYIEYKDGNEPTTYNPKSTQIQNQSNTLATKRKEHIYNAMKHVWDGYTMYAYGKDELAPLSNKGKDKWGGLATTLVDSLDTLWLMGMKDEFYNGRDWIQDNLNFNKSADVSVFETTIRSLGGLLSAYDLSGDSVFLEKAEDLGQRLLKAFGDGGSLPFGKVNLQSGRGHNLPWIRCKGYTDNDDERERNSERRHEHGRNDDDEGRNRSKLRGRSSERRQKDVVTFNQNSACVYLAEAGTLQVEFRKLAKATGNPHYKDQVENLFDLLESIGKDGVYTSVVGQNEKGPIADKIGSYSFGATNDSFYEYMLKLWLQGGRKEQKYRDMYDKAIDAMHRKLLKQAADDLWIIGVMNQSGQYQEVMEHLACFMGGLLALGAYTDPNGLNSERAQRDLKTARAVTYTCYQMYASTPTGLSPEVMSASQSFSPRGGAAYYLIRPEFVESLYILNHLTGDPIYREWGWEIFQSIEKYCKTESGYAEYGNVLSTDRPLSDSIESFVLAETFKYLYLLFDSEAEIDILNKHVFNTEAHPLQIFNADEDLA